MIEFEGRPAVLGIAVDITERHAARGAAARERESAAGADREQLRRRAHHRSRTCRVRYVGPSIERILGLRPEEMVGDDNLHRIHPDDREQVRAAYARIAGRARPARLGDLPHPPSRRLVALVRELRHQPARRSVRGGDHRQQPRHHRPRRGADRLPQPGRPFAAGPVDPAGHAHRLRQPAHRADHRLRDRGAARARARRAARAHPSRRPGGRVAARQPARGRGLRASHTPSCASCAATARCAGSRPT